MRAPRPLLVSGLHSSKSASNVVADRELRASVDAMAAVNTAGMSRQELVAHNKNLKVTITIFSNSFINLIISKFNRERGNHTLGITHS